MKGRGGSGGAGGRGRRSAGGAAGPKRRRADRAGIHIFPNDPDASVGLVPATPLDPAGGEPPFVIEGQRYAPAAYDPGTPAFQFWQGEIALARTIRVWENLFDRDFAAWHGGRALKVRLRAGKDLNAFYDRKSLQFFYDVDRVTGRTVYAVESLDIVAHEAGHAILDVYQPGYWASIDLETASFHEAFGDCSALVATLTDPAVRRGLLVETGGAIGRSNLVSRVAEALGRAIHNNFGPGAISDPTRLRDANNEFRYSPPELLRPGGDDTALTPEPHSFSRVFTGAFYDTLAWLLGRAFRDDPTEAAVERSARLAGRLLARAVETLPPGEARFREVALRMREIDQREEGGVATIGIEESFARHGIRLPALEGRTREGSRGGRQAGKGGRVQRGRGRNRSAAPSVYRALRSLDPDRPGGAAALRAALGVPRGARLKRRTLPARVGGQVREQFVYEESVVVRNARLGRWSGVVVRVQCGCTLTRDPSGDVEGASLAPLRHASATELARKLRCWIRLDAIHDARRGAARPVRQLFRDRKPFRVGRAGVLERIYFD